MNEIEIGKAAEHVAQEVRINNKSDFPLAIRLIRGGVRVAWPDVDFRLRASVDGCMCLYKASRTGDCFVNCKKGDDGELICFFDNHGLHDGILRIEVTLFYPDENYKVDGFRQETFTAVSNIHLVKDSGDALDLNLASGGSTDARSKMSEEQENVANAAIKAVGSFTNASILKESDLINTIVYGLLSLRKDLKADSSSSLWDDYADFAARKSFENIPLPIFLNNSEKDLSIKFLPQNISRNRNHIVCRKLTIEIPYKGYGEFYANRDLEIDTDELVVSSNTETSADQMRTFYVCLRDSQVRVRHLVVKGSDSYAGTGDSVQSYIPIISSIKGLEKITLDHTKNTSKKLVELIRQYGIETEFIGDYDGNEDAIIVPPVDSL